MDKEDKVLVDKEYKAILNRFISTIPDIVYGTERIEHILENIEQIPANERAVLKSVVDRMLTSMIERDASDLELGGYATGGYVWIRVYGAKEKIEEFPKFSLDEAAVLIANMLNRNQRKYVVTTRNLDFSYSFFYERKKVLARFRSCAYFDLETLALNLRAISTAVRPLSSIEFHPNVVKAMSHKYIKFGLSLVTGITGSGKSTTLDAIIDDHNKYDPAHIVIIASPVEYIHTSNVSFIRHREVGRDVLSFKDGVIQALRQDPDIIVIGEMRDPETIMAALEVTDTGHKVFSTLHTSSAVESIDRIVAEISPAEQERVRNRLADVLISVVSQKLVPGTDGKLVLAKEVLIVTPSVRAAIKNNNTSEIYMMINQGAQSGMITLEQDLKRLYLSKRITMENAIAFANNKTRIKQILTSV